MIERVVLVSPRGACAGVSRAIAAVERALAIFPPPVFVRRAIVHNVHVVARLAGAGARFVDELDEVPDGSVVVLSAHGVAAIVRERAEARALRIIDATCPLVAKVHEEVRRFAALGYDVVLIGRAGHDEVVGTLGQVPGVQLVERPSDVGRLRVADPDRVACVTQTTLSPRDVGPVVDRMRRRFPALARPAADVCYATRNRQAAVTWLARRVDAVLVVGDATSSNSLRLREVAESTGTRAWRVGDPDEIDARWLAGAHVVGVTSGASTPDDVVAGVVARLCRDGAVLEEAVFAEEHVAFGLPPELEALDARPADRADRRTAGRVAVASPKVHASPLPPGAGPFGRP